ncbi:noncanonical pyrimidine nucleotidase, YjjG family [Fulvivirga sp. RKSG066]|uniref:YjjG family noncanonical pyrimidine nucleotidase n=1 Tax=Fulvivirga aurantia TaxID=2529383 RepID=UPI0012BD2D23|nr:YjjG family noncanonical pyrimidine nucleotidase [Fulvivirga aurantia]MTI20940.1 noncanonical pyrimidine nucleotidase, YjjG family [Fulvivirga aurantia]
MQRYEVIFFDLDHTLWDYDKNSVEALSDLYIKYGLNDYKDVSLDLFLNTFTQVNEKLWSNYNKGHVDREHIRNTRFDSILKNLGIKNRSFSTDMSVEYIKECPQKTNLFPYTLDVLDYLQQKYRLFILTNGFDDVQQIKITKSNLKPYFKGMITSDGSGHRKPSKEIFEYALGHASAKSDKSLMIGDNLSADVKGAINASIDAVYFNPHKRAHKATINYEINCLSQLMDIL